MSYVTHHPAVLEHTLRWQDLNDIEQEALLETVRANGASTRLQETFDVEMPCFFTIQFPLVRVNPQASANTYGTLRILAEPRASKQDAELQTPSQQ